MIKNSKSTPVKKAGWLSAGSTSASVFALMSATLGAGALTTHEAVKTSGIPVAIGMFTFVFAVSVLSSILIVFSLNYSKMGSMEEMAARGFGFRFAVFFEICMILFCFGAAVSYMITVYDIYKVLMGAVLVSMGYEVNHETGAVLNPDLLASLLTNRSLILCLATVFVLLPLSLLDKVNSLRFTSFLGVSAVIFLAMTVDTHLISAGIWEGFHGDGGIAKMFAGQGIIGYLHTFDLAIFAFTCQSNVPAIYLELAQRTPTRMSKIIFTGLGVCFSIYVAIGFGGYLAFGNDASGSLLNAFAPGFLKMKEQPILKMMELCAFFGMIATVLFAYPLNVFPTRQSVLSLLFRSYPQLRAKERKLSVFIAVMCVTLTLLCALFFQQISMVMSLAGCTAGAACCVIAPGLFFLKFSPGGNYDPKDFELEIQRRGLEDECSAIGDNELLFHPNHGAASFVSGSNTPSFFAYPHRKSVTGGDSATANPLRASTLDPTLLALAPAVEMRGVTAAEAVADGARVKRSSIGGVPEISTRDRRASATSSSFADESAAILPLDGKLVVENAEMAAEGAFDGIDEDLSVEAIPNGDDVNGLSDRQIVVIRRLCKFLVVFGTFSALMGTTCWILDNFVLNKD